MPAGIREPNLPAPLDGQLRELIAFTADELSRYGERPDDSGRVPYASPVQLFEMLTAQTRRLAVIAREFRNGARIRDGSEPTGAPTGGSWRGSSLRTDDALIARLAAGDPERATVARTAARTYDDLARRGMFGLGAPSRERFIAAAVASHERGPRVIGGCS